MPIVETGVDEIAAPVQMPSPAPLQRNLSRDLAAVADAAAHEVPEKMESSGSRDGPPQPEKVLDENEDSQVVLASPAQPVKTGLKRKEHHFEEVMDVDAWDETVCSACGGKRSSCSCSRVAKLQAKLASMKQQLRARIARIIFSWFV